MSYQSPEVVSIEYNNNHTLAKCDVRFVDLPPPTANAGHRTISITAFIPLSAGDQEDVVRERAITVARQAIVDAAQAP